MPAKPVPDKEIVDWNMYLGPAAWRQFVLPVTLSAGSYEITSRAIAADGGMQPEQRVENERGYAHNGWRDHAVKVSVA